MTTTHSVWLHFIKTLPPSKLLYFSGGKAENVRALSTTCFHGQFAYLVLTTIVNYPITCQKHEHTIYQHLCKTNSDKTVGENVR